MLRNKRSFVTKAANVYSTTSDFMWVLIMISPLHASSCVKSPTPWCRVDYCRFPIESPGILLHSPPTALSRCEASYCTGNSHVYFFRAPGNFLILRPPGASPAPTEKAGEPCLESAGPAAPALKLNPALAVPGVPGVPGADPNIPD